MRDLPRLGAHAPRALYAQGMSMSEYLSLATLVDEYAHGEDMTETLKRLLAIQQFKREQSLSSADMRSALNHPLVAQLRAAVAAVARARNMAH